MSDSSDRMENLVILKNPEVPAPAADTTTSDTGDTTEKLTISTGPELPAPTADTAKTTGLAATTSSPESLASTGAFRDTGTSHLPQFPTIKINFGTAATSNPFRFGVQDDNGAQYKAMEPARMDQNLRRHLPESTIRVRHTQAFK
jgi:hypothetical protein